MNRDDDPQLDAVRSELRRLGYLSTGFDRYLLQDALRPQHGLVPLLVTAARVGLLAGLVVAPLVAFALAIANGLLATTPFDVVPLVVHLLVPVAVVAGLGYLVLGLLLLLVLRLYPVRHIERLALAAALVVSLAAAVATGLLLRGVLAQAAPWERALAAAALPFAVYAVTRVLQSGLLSLAIRLTDRAPLRLLRGSRRALGAAALGALALLAVSALVVHRDDRPEPPVLPSAPGETAVLVGIDGVLPAELDYLLARGELPAMARLAAEGLRTAYVRPEGPPAAFWATVATGLPAPVHGVAALDSFRPLGVRTPLARNGPLRAYWSEIAVPLRLAEHRPVLAARRSAFAFWELAARGGDPAAAIAWWATYPAEPLPGLVVSHGAYGLLREGRADAVAPATRSAELAAVANRIAADPPPPVLSSGLTAADAARVDANAVAPDRFAREVLRSALAASPRAAALYLSALDVAAVGWTGNDLVFADVVREELREADRLIGELAERFGTVIVVADPGRRAPGEGRIFVWRRSGCGGAARPATVTPEVVAPTLLRALGLPQSRELSEPLGCGFGDPPAVVDSYGTRRPREAGSGPEGEEYLRNLQSLGYI